MSFTKKGVWGPGTLFYVPTSNGRDYEIAVQGTHTADVLGAGVQYWDSLRLPYMIDNETGAKLKPIMMRSSYNPNVYGLYIFIDKGSYSNTLNYYTRDSMPNSLTLTSTTNGYTNFSNVYVHWYRVQFYLSCNLVQCTSQYTLSSIDDYAYEGTRGGKQTTQLAYPNRITWSSNTPHWYAANSSYINLNSENSQTNNSYWIGKLPNDISQTTGVYTKPYYSSSLGSGGVFMGHSMTYTVVSGSGTPDTSNGWCRDVYPTSEMLSIATNGFPIDVPMVVNKQAVVSFSRNTTYDEGLLRAEDRLNITCTVDGTNDFNKIDGLPITMTIDDDQSLTVTPTGTYNNSTHKRTELHFNVPSENYFPAAIKESYNIKFNWSEALLQPYFIYKDSYSLIWGVAAHEIRENWEWATTVTYTSQGVPYPVSYDSSFSTIRPLKYAQFSVSSFTGVKQTNHNATRVLLCNNEDLINAKFQSSVFNNWVNAQPTFHVQFSDDQGNTQAWPIDPVRTDYTSTFNLGPFTTPPFLQGRPFSIYIWGEDAIGRQTTPQVMRVFTDSSLASSTEITGGLRSYLYTSPRITLTGYRCNSSGTIDEKNGTYVKITAAYTYKMLDWGEEEPDPIGTTQPVLTIRANNQTPTSYNLSAESGTQDGQFSGMAITNGQDFYATVTDPAGYSVSTHLFVPSGQITVSLKPGGKGVAIGMWAENENQLDVAWNTLIHGNLTVTGNVNIAGEVVQAQAASSITYDDVYNIGATDVQSALNILSQNGGSGSGGNIQALNVSFVDTNTRLNAVNVQAAIEKLNTKVNDLEILSVTDVNSLINTRVTTIEANLTNTTALANTANNVANQALEKANTASDQATAAAGQANSALSQVNQAIAASSDATQTANAATATANTSSALANQAITVANSAVNRANECVDIVNGIIDGNQIAF